MEKNIETYIVWFKKEFEVAGKAAEALNGQVICYPSNDESLTDKIGCKLAELGYSANLISAIVPVAEYVRMENEMGSVPNMTENRHTAAVSFSVMNDHDAWTALLRQPGFADMLTDDQAQEVFQSIMRGRDVGYSMLMEALFDSGMPDNDCFVLVPVPQIGGYDDIAYLLKNAEYGPSDHIEFLEQVVSEKTAAWLFERNEATVLQWMEGNGLNWGNFTDLNASRPESKGEVIHKAIKSWAVDTVRRYLNSLPLQNF